MRRRRRRRTLGKHLKRAARSLARRVRVRAAP